MDSVLPHSPERPRRTVETVLSLHERKQQVVREAIWDTATDLFAEKGFHETTVDDIAIAAGVSLRVQERLDGARDGQLWRGTSGGD